MNYIYQGYDTPELVAKVEAASSQEKLLLREMFFKFGVKVFDVREPHFQQAPSEFFLCDGVSGIEVGNVSVTGSDSSPEFCFYAEHYSKSRGSSQTDRRTLRSVKLSSLMATIKKCQAIPNMKEFASDCLTYVMGSSLHYVMKEILRDGKVGNSNHKRHECDVNTEAYHAMLKMFFNEASPDVMMSFDRHELKKHLDKMNNFDNVTKEAERYTKEFALSDYHYCIGTTQEGDYLVAKCKVNDVTLNKDNRDDKVTLEVQEIKRVKSIRESYSDLVPFLTMVKTTRESNLNCDSAKNNDDWFLPRTDKHFQDMGYTTVYGIGKIEVRGWFIAPCTAF